MIIPARYGSTRLPGKPLIKLDGLTMIERVYVKAQESGAARVVVATDNREILQEVKGFGGDGIMTSQDHLSGTERVCEAATILDLGENDIIVNVQGDEPQIPPRLIQQVAAEINQENEVVTLCERIKSVEDFLNKNVVKVVRDKKHRALYFSRSPIPCDPNASPPSINDLFNSEYLRHIGIYAYTFRKLKSYVKHEPCNLELIEKLEQLRMLVCGMSIKVIEALISSPPGVDTLEDAKRVDYQLREEE